MNWLECILIVAGISLDLFATMEIEGAKLGEIKKSTLLITSGLVTLLQLGFFFGGYAICYNVSQNAVFKNSTWLGQIIAFVIFILLAVRLLIKAVKQEFVDEKRCEITRFTYVRIIFVTSIYAIFAGCAAGFLSANVWILLTAIIVCSFLVVLSGLYTGYMMGFKGKTIFYSFGSAVLFMSAVFQILKMCGGVKA